MRPKALALVLALACLAGPGRLWGQEWTRFRGPNGAGLSDAKGMPVQWTEQDRKWKTALPGVGHSSPVIWGNKVFLTSGLKETGKRIVLCLDADDGRILWQRQFDSTIHRPHALNSFGTASPAVDARGVYVCWASPDQYVLLALDHEGKDLWRRDLGPFASQHGQGCSPIVHDGMVILPNDQDGTSFLLAVDASTGTTRWQADRRSAKACYATACLHEPAGRAAELILSSQAHGLTSIDPRSGKVNWELPDLFTQRTCASPVVAGGLIVVSCGTGGGGVRMVAVRPPSAGPPKQPEVAWEMQKGSPYVPTPIAVGELLFLFHDGGAVACVRADSGKELWRERISGAAFYGSPVCVEGRLYCISTKGEVIVLAAGEQFELLARNSLGEASHATPAVAGGRMFLRTVSSLVCIGAKQ